MASTPETTRPFWRGLSPVSFSCPSPQLSCGVGQRTAQLLEERAHAHAFWCLDAHAEEILAVTLVRKLHPGAVDLLKSRFERAPQRGEIFGRVARQQAIIDSKQR